jgi:hypothetical protein
VRGSSTFTPTKEGLLGVVHFSEELTPRHYYHMLVLLDANTLLPMKYSQTFCFQRLGIEFCIGFSIQENQYIFWISQMDRDPLMLVIPETNLELSFDVL